QLVVVQHGRWSERVSAVVGPEDGVGAGEVAVPPELDGEEVWAAHGINDTAGGNWIRYHAAAEAGGFPYYLAGRRLIPTHLGGGADHHFSTAVIGHDERLRPGAFFVAIDAPQFFACVLVNGDKVRAFFMVEFQVERIRAQAGRRSLAEL